MGSRQRKNGEGLDFLVDLARRIDEIKALRDGDLLFSFADGQTAALRARRGRVEVVSVPGQANEPLVEIMGDRARIRAIVTGEKDARKQFLAGGLRVRGDLALLSDLAMALGILDEPL